MLDEIRLVSLTSPKYVCLTRMRDRGWWLRLVGVACATCGCSWIRVLITYPELDTFAIFRCVELRQCDDIHVLVK